MKNNDANRIFNLSDLLLFKKLNTACGGRGKIEFESKRNMFNLLFFKKLVKNLLL